MQTTPAALSTLPAPLYADDEPRCHCPTPTPWASRKDGGRWDLEGDAYEQRTCPECVASLSRVTT